MDFKSKPGEGIGVGDFALDGTISSPGNRN